MGRIGKMLLGSLETVDDVSATVDEIDDLVGDLREPVAPVDGVGPQTGDAGGESSGGSR